MASKKAETKAKLKPVPALKNPRLVPIKTSSKEAPALRADKKSRSLEGTLGTPERATPPKKPAGAFAKPTSKSKPISGSSKRTLAANAQSSREEAKKAPTKTIASSSPPIVTTPKKGSASGRAASAPVSAALEKKQAALAAKAKATKAAPPGAAAAKAPPAKAPPAKATAVQAKPAKAPAKAKAAPVKATAVQAPPAKAPPAKATGVKATAVKATAVKATAVKAATAVKSAVKAAAAKAAAAVKATAKAPPASATAVKATPVKAAPAKGRAQPKEVPSAKRSPDVDHDDAPVLEEAATKALTRRGKSKEGPPRTAEAVPNGAHGGVAVGDHAPSFVLQDESGTVVSSETLRGSPYVLYFYPKDDTPGCTLEACGFRDSLPRFSAKGVRILGVSPDLPELHARFKKKYDLTFSLLSDPEKTLAKAYGVWVKKQNYGREYMGVERSTFYVDKHGTVSKVWRGVKVPGHVDVVLDAV